jgi:endoglucanase
MRSPFAMCLRHASRRTSSSLSVPPDRWARWALLCALGACSSRPSVPVLAGKTTPASGAATGPATGGELLQRSTFEDRRTLPWMSLFIEPAQGEAFAKDGAYCVRIDKQSEQSWDVQIRHREMIVQNGHDYTVRYRAWASRPTDIGVQIAMSGAPYTSYWSDPVRLDATPKPHEESFRMQEDDDPTAEFSFHLSDPKAKAPVTICVDDLHLTDPAFTPPDRGARAAVPAIRVNQMGYFPGGPKRATRVLTGEPAAAKSDFELLDANGTVVHRGTPSPLGKDPTSGLSVEQLDFSAFTGTGTGFRLRMGGPGQSAVASDPFAIQPRLYQKLSRDALRYFYYTRSGIALAQPYVEKQTWVSPAGHPTDAKVSCAPDAGCTRTLDVSGGWYDAGDYGKYVVSGAFSTYLLINLWEVSQGLGLHAPGAKDGELNLPESGNGKADLLDEARWEVEWMLKMQVPEGDPQAGLVHHKIHDADWTALATPPLLTEKVPRYLRPVSTAATLDLAAAAAQAARVFAPLDSPFAEKCLVAARRAWAAAERFPALLITSADHKGGGAYEDANITDERFWAAVELYLTTGEKTFLEVVRKSPHFEHPKATASQGLVEAVDWQTVDLLGTMSLALDTHRVSAEVREGNRRAIVAVAEQYLALASSDRFGQPYAGTRYVWGSNSFIVNNGLVLALAHAFTQDRKYLDGAAGAMDYVLGRNALGKSYVSGYGARPLENPHHRLWSHFANPKFPPPPPGILSGGPNTDMQDPYMKAGFTGCVGQTCYVDHIEAYSVNEVAINWNAAFAWLSAYLNAVM